MTGVNLHQQTPALDALRHLDEPVRQRMRALEVPAMPAQSLRRTGQRSYAFNGQVIATICGVTPALPYWYELNVFETVLETFVCDVRLFNKGDQADLFRVAEVPTMDVAFAWFENYDPSADLPAPPVPAANLSNASLVLLAARLQMEVNRIDTHYRTMAGELLNALQPRLS